MNRFEAPRAWTQCKEDYITGLKPSPGKWLGLLVFSLFSASMGAVQLTQGRWIVGCVLIGWGVLGVVASITALFSDRMVLRLTPKGFSYGTLRKKYFFKWSDIGLFGVGSVGDRKTCFTLRREYSGDEKLRGVNRGAIGFDRFLPDTYGMNAMELAKLLEEWRHQYSDNKETELP